jgi:uncharacterized Zn finger protein
VNEYERKSLELATRNGLTWAWARFYTSAYGGKELWKVQSKTDSTVKYTVESKAGHATACSCPAGTWGKPCCHAGAVVMKLAWREQQIAAERGESATDEPQTAA